MNCIQSTFPNLNNNLSHKIEYMAVMILSCTISSIYTGATHGVQHMIQLYKHIVANIVNGSIVITNQTLRH
jgi:hypothetical protein